MPTTPLLRLFLLIALFPVFAFAEQGSFLEEIQKNGLGSFRISATGTFTELWKTGEVVVHPLAWNGYSSPEMLVGRIETGDSVEFILRRGRAVEKYGIIAGDKPFFHQDGMGPPHAPYSVTPAMPISEFHARLKPDALASYTIIANDDGGVCLVSPDPAGQARYLTRFCSNEKGIISAELSQRLNSTIYPLYFINYDPPISKFPWVGNVEASIFTNPYVEGGREFRRISAEVKVELVEGTFEEVASAAEAELSRGTVDVPAAHRYAPPLKKVMSDVDLVNWINEQRRATKTGSAADTVEPVEASTATTDIVPLASRSFIIGGVLFLIVAGILMMRGRH